MEESLMNLDHNDHNQVIRGKRTKRSRLSIITTSSSENSCVENSEEDEDMANCLIMLAQSGSCYEKPKVEKSEFCLYECKTCNRSFSCFQALGGHRASHKKPKSSDQEKQISNDLRDHEEDVQHKRIISDDQLISKRKVHECLICGMEFASGQALGGHMRRHRNNLTTNSISDYQTNIIAKSCDRAGEVLQLDLNLPAPEDHYRDSKFQFLYSSQAPALVDCQY